MRLAILGTRGIPASYGGFETFAEELAVRLAGSGVEVTVYCEKNDNPLKEYRGVSLWYSRYSKSANPVLYYLDTIRAASKSSDVLLVNGVGGSIFYAIPRVSGRPVVTNFDGIESRRMKWPFLKRLYIRLCEYLAVKSSTAVVADAEAIKAYIVGKYRGVADRVAVIEYGSYVNTSMSPETLLKYSLKHGDYYLAVGRLEPENNIAAIVDGFAMSGSKRSLVVVGNILKTRYVDRILSCKSSSVRFVGGVYDKKELNSLRFSCYAYIHGHSVGGTNPSLLESLGSGNISICQDNPFNREVTDSKMYYFKDSYELAERIKDVERLDAVAMESLKRLAVERIRGRYSWDSISEKYRDLFERIAHKRG